MRLTASQRVAAMTPMARADLLARFDIYCHDGHNRAACLTMHEAELLVAIANEATEVGVSEVGA